MDEWNWRGINDKCMRIEVYGTFRKGNLGILGLCKTRLKGSVTSEWSGL